MSSMLLLVVLLALLALLVVLSYQLGYDDCLSDAEQEVSWLTTTEAESDLHELTRRAFIAMAQRSEAECNLPGEQSSRPDAGQHS